MKLTEYLRPELIVPDLEPGEQEHVFARLVEPLARAGIVEDADAVAAALLARERTLSTGIGQGIAVPHAVCPQIRRTAVVVGVSPEGIDFGAIDERPVHLFFVLVSPPGRASQHIKLLARIARLMRDPRLQESLRSAQGPEAVFEAVAAYERQHV